MENNNFWIQEYVHQMSLLLDLPINEESKDGVIADFEKIKDIAEIVNYNEALILRVAAILGTSNLKNIPPPSRKTFRPDKCTNFLGQFICWKSLRKTWYNSIGFC